jgi:hypothetical protein
VYHWYKFLSQSGSYVVNQRICLLLLLVLLCLCVEEVSVHVTIFNTFSSVLWCLVRGIGKLYTAGCEGLTI